MKTLIIGCKGFIGFHLYNHYKKQNTEVFGCDVVTDYQDKNYFQIDATNSDYHTIFEKNKFDVCINCSGAASVPLSLENPLKDFYLNTANVFIILNAIKTYNSDCKFINLSSAAIYGNPQSLPIKESHSYNPMSPYGIHKMQSEQIVKEFHQFYNLKTCSVRIFSAYGEGLKKQLFWDMFQKFKNNTIIELYGTGKETRDFIYIEDIMQAIDCVIKNAKFSGEAINLANGIEHKIKDIAQIFNQAMENNREIVFNNKVKQGDPLNWKADISLLKNLGYEQKISVETGIKNYVKWAKDIM